MTIFLPLFSLICYYCY